MKERILKEIAKVSNQSFDVVECAVLKAKDMGIELEEYIQFYAWELSEEELKELASLLVKIREQKKEREEWYIDLIHNKTWRSKKAIRKDLEQFNELGISTLQYIRKGLYYPFKAKKELKKITNKKGKDKFKKNKYFWKICDATGWKPSKVEMEVSKAWLNCGANYEDYFLYKMHECSLEEQRTYLTREQSYKMSSYFNFYFYNNTLMNSKVTFNKIFAQYMKRRWFINQKLSYQEFLKKIDGLKYILVKPARSTQGKGIEKINCNVEDKKSLYDKVMDFPKSVVEEFIVQHESINAICDTSVNTLRVVTLNHDKKCNFLFAVFRIGQGKVVDNFHAGGIAAAVDVETGKVIAHATDLEGNIYETHPISGVEIKGLQIPNWDCLLETCKKIYNRIPGVNLVGWDFAITPDGVDLIEGNTAPSLGIGQCCVFQNGEGLYSSVIEPYLPKE